MERYTSVRYFLYGMVCVGLSVWIGTCSAYLQTVSPKFVQRMVQQFGQPAAYYLHDWQNAESHLPTWQTVNASTAALSSQTPSSQAALPALTTISSMPLLRAANNLANQVPYLDDLSHWEQEEYWATPAEFVSSHGGDCEDFAIAKYFSLIAAGMPPQRLRMVYVRALFQGRIVNHMVLAYYETPTADPLILDNIQPQVTAASRRPDLVPVFSFNDDDSTKPSREAAMVRRWRALRERIDIEVKG